MGTLGRAGRGGMRVQEWGMKRQGAAGRQGAQRHSICAGWRVPKP